MTANSTFEASASPSTFSLQISDPVSLLNEIARRYESVERIVMEYIDNALDDAESLYLANAEMYPFVVRIEVEIDLQHRYIVVRDNCRGMYRETLERIVINVGESQKRGLTWVNGQFGFGVHAFRAAAANISFRTKNADDDHLELRLHREQHRDIQRPWINHEAFPSDRGTGTEVTLGPFDEEWFEAISIESIKREIERHFERLLARSNLSVTVRAVGGAPVSCEPFDYSAIDGQDFRRTLDLEVGGRLHTVEVYLKVADIEVQDRAVRFFQRGRRINEVAAIDSFIRRSVHRTSVWGHPHLLGFIDVGEVVRPVITRDDFQRTRGRAALYEAILDLEDEIKDALEVVNEAHRDTSLTRLEDVMRDVLDDLAREDRLRLRSELASGTETGVLIDGGGIEDSSEGGPISEISADDGDWSSDGEGDVTGPEPKGQGSQSGQGEGGHQVIDDASNAQGTKRRRAGFDIKFGNFPPDVEGQLRRSRLVDGIIYINTAHPDFQERMAYSRLGKPRFTDRLGGYLAATVSIHYKDQFYLRYGRQPERRDQMFDEQVEFMCRLEAALRPHLSTLQREFMGDSDQEVADE